MAAFTIYSPHGEVYAFARDLFVFSQGFRGFEDVHVGRGPREDRIMKKRLVLMVALLGSACAELTDFAPTETRSRPRDGAVVDGEVPDGPAPDGPLPDVMSSDTTDGFVPDVVSDSGDAVQVADADDVGDAGFMPDVPTDVLADTNSDVPADTTPMTDVGDGGDVVMADAADVLDASDVPVDATPVDRPDSGGDAGDADAASDAPADAPADTTDVPADTGPSCPTGQRLCGASCRLIATDVTNCGACDRMCPSYASSSSTCSSGVCGFTCNAGFGNCDGNDSNGCETSLESTIMHCGMCGRACTVGSICVGGMCMAMACMAPLTTCGSDCVDTRSNVAHCGICRNVCSFSNASAVCTSSACALGTCNAGFGNCDGNATNGCEADTRSNASHCGSCGNACPARANASSACVSSVCGFTCNAGFGNCDGNATNGCEADTRSNASHCGSCGNACLSGLCTGGVCAPLVLPVFEVVYGHPDITGMQVRITNGRFPNDVGAFVTNPCLPPISTTRRSCRIDLRRMHIPNGEMPPRLFASTSDWRSTYGVEIIFLGAGGVPVCSGPDCRLPSGTVCSSRTVFSCASVLCNSGAAPMNPTTIRYDPMYHDAGYGFRIAGSDVGVSVCLPME